MVTFAVVVLAFLSTSREALTAFGVLLGLALIVGLASWDLPRCSKCGSTGRLVRSDPYLCFRCDPRCR